MGVCRFIAHSERAGRTGSHIASQPTLNYARGSIFSSISDLDHWAPRLVAIPYPFRSSPLLASVIVSCYVELVIRLSSAGCGLLLLVDERSL